MSEMRNPSFRTFSSMLGPQRRSYPTLPSTADWQERGIQPPWDTSGNRRGPRGSASNLQRMAADGLDVSGFCVMDSTCRTVTMINLLPLVFVILMICSSSVSFILEEHRLGNTQRRSATRISRGQSRIYPSRAAPNPAKVNRSIVQDRDRKDAMFETDGDVAEAGIPEAFFNFSRGESGGQRCMGFRATTKCSPKARRVPSRDRKCDQPVQGQSGYCEFADIETGNIGYAMPLYCNSLKRRPHSDSKSPVTCNDAVLLASFEAASVAYRAPWQEPGPSSTIPGSRAVILSVADSIMVSAYAAVRLLRSLGCRLTIELWHFADEVRDSRILLEELVLLYGVSVRDITAPRDTICPDHDSKCFATKPYILFHTRYEQVLLLDTDNFPVRDPTYVFDSEEFRATGAVFWPDFWSPENTLFNIHSRSVLWPVTGLAFTDMFEQESSAVLVDRSRALSMRHQHSRKHSNGGPDVVGASGTHSPLHILMFYAHPRSVLLRWSLVYGDKDLFRLAWMRAQRPFHMIQRPPGLAGQSGPDGFCGSTMVQHDPAGRVLFMHRNTCKLERHWSTRQVEWKELKEYVGPNTTTVTEDCSNDREALPWQDAKLIQQKVAMSNCTSARKTLNQHVMEAATVHTAPRSIDYLVSTSPFKPRHSSKYTCNVCYWVPKFAAEGFRTQFVVDHADLQNLESNILGFARDAALSLDSPGVYRTFTREWWHHAWRNVVRKAIGAPARIWQWA